VGIFDYKSFYDKVGFENGWNFSKLNYAVEGHMWDFFDEVRKICKMTDIVLDIGTGGGEQALPLADDVLLLIGIDNSAGMISTATKNLIDTRNKNVRYFQMDANKLEFPVGFFNVVTSRQAPFNAFEVTKVLDDNGVFLTQQVCEDDKRNLKHFFGRGQNYGVQDGTSKRAYMKELEEAGFDEIVVQEYNVTEYYKTVEDLLFLLKYTPIIPNFGMEHNDFELLEQFVKINSTEKGIKTNSKRYLIKAYKKKKF